MTGEVNLSCSPPGSADGLHCSGEHWAGEGCRDEKQLTVGSPASYAPNGLSAEKGGDDSCLPPQDGRGWWTPWRRTFWQKTTGWSQLKSNCLVTACLRYACHYQLRGTTPTTPSPLIPILGESWSKDWIIILEELWNEDSQERQYVLFQKRKLNAFEYYWMMLTILPCIPNSYLLLFGEWNEWRNTT